ncbi:hypothetical protein ACFP1Z_16800 [Streptomyces gamaensis]|uniref:Uncharacterized protein n=1 Tax=Streptomyces gamaensis TaxID=1763542 RepID=A0ABW0Z451_9ACTN
MSFGQGGPDGARGDSGRTGGPWGTGGGPASAPGQGGHDAASGGPYGPGLPGAGLPQPPGGSAPGQGGHGYGPAAPDQPRAAQGHPPLPGGPYGPGLPQPQAPAHTPDWAALAETTAARGRRRKWLYAGGGVLAAGAVAAAVATAVTHTQSGGNKALPAPARSAGGSPGPSFSQVAPPPPPDPREFIANAGKDTAPLTTESFFPHPRPVLAGRPYQRTATDSGEDCAAGAQAGLGPVLTGNGCRRLLRATYVRDGVAVTVGVAVFDDQAAADRVKEQATGNIAPLPGGDAPAFCQGGLTCRLTTNSIGRYAYFTVAGFTNGTSVTAADTRALAAARDLSDYAFQRVMARANAAAAASVSRSEHA